MSFDLKSLQTGNGKQLDEDDDARLKQAIANVSNELRLQVGSQAEGRC